MMTDAEYELVRLLCATNANLLKFIGENWPNVEGEPGANRRIASAMRRRIDERLTQVEAERDAAQPRAITLRD